MALLALGRRDAALAVVDSMLAEQPRTYFNPYGIAAVYAALGDADHAFPWLEQAYEQRTVWLLYLNVDEAFTPVRQDPRYPAMLRRIGLAP